MDIQINLLSHSNSRFNFSKKNLIFLSKINEEYKTRIKLHIYTDKNIHLWQSVSNELNDLGINTSVINKGGYLPKIFDAIETNSTYSCSMDEDVLMSDHVWDGLISHLYTLDNDNHLLLSPLITNGIPTVELFIESFFSDEEKEKLYSMFTKTNIPNLWGADYSSLNLSLDRWDSDLFYERVTKLNHYYKGIHPVRVSAQCQKNIAEVICSKKNEFLSKQNYSLLVKNLPYFCNNIFFIKTEVWKKIINDRTLFRDSFDEVPLNIYKERENKKFVFLNNAYALHMAYNTLGKESQLNIENYYYNNFL